METTLRTASHAQSISRYWGLVKNLDDEMKLELVAMLINSMRQHEASSADEQRERAFRSLAGCWAEDKGDDDVEEILLRSRESRRGNRNVPSFDE